MKENQHNLKQGSILQNYEIIHVLGEGGFGITYLAKDTSLGLEVVIKEYFPNEFAMRSGDSTITAKSKSKGDFSKGMQRFKEEAQTLARFNHPSIVKILGYFEANDTAYFVMEYEEGIDLSQYLKQKDTSLKQEEILSIIMPILEGLKEVHAHNYLHRDIKPGNILLRSNNSPVLIDFGASKLAIGEASKSITSMLTEGYAPLEQYSTDIKQQGAFTDIYAIAAVVYKIITGNVPSSAQTRSYQLLQDDNDPYVPLLSLSLSGYDVSFLKAIDRALSMKAKDRPQNVQEFQENIAGKFVQKEKKADVAGGKKEHTNETKKSNSSLMIALGVMIVVAGGVLGYLLLKKQNVPESSKVVQKQTEEEVKIKAKKENKKTFKEDEKERKEAEKIVEEVMKKVQEEKEAIVPPKIDIPKVPVWDAYKAEQIIYDKLRNYGGIRTYGFDRVADQYPSMRLKHKIIGFYELPYKYGKHMLAITSSSPKKNYDCHVCAPKLSFFEFAIENGEWIVETSYINTLQFGSWGGAPKKEEISVVELNQDKFGLLFDSSYSAQGYTEEMKNIYVLDSRKVKNIFSEIIGLSDGGARDVPEDSWKGSINFDKNGSPLYDIVLYKIGLVNAKKVDEKILYKYNGDKYVKQEQQVKHTLPNVLPSSPQCTYFTVTEVKQLNIRSKPGKPSKVVGRANQGESVCVYSFTGKWGKTDRGWISGKYLSKDDGKNNYILADIDKDGNKERLEWKCFSGCNGDYQLYQLKLYDDDGSLLWSGPMKMDYSNPLVGSMGDGDYMPGIFHDIDDDSNIELIMAGFGSDASHVQSQIYRWTGKKFIKTELSGSYLLWTDAPQGNTLKWSKKYPDTYNKKVWSVGDFYQLHDGEVIAEIMGVKSGTGELFMYPTSAKIRFTPTGAVIQEWIK